MSWERPDLKTLHSRISGDLSARLLDGGAILPGSVLAVLAKVWAGAAHGMHAFFAWLFLQVFPDTAEAEYMRRWAAVWHIVRKSAAPARGAVLFSGADGAVLPAHTLLINQGTQQQYAVEADAHISGGHVVAPVRAVTPGAAANLAPGAELRLISPVAGFMATAQVHAEADGSGLSGGADEESDASLRARLLARLRMPPRGGSAADYVRWALEVPGVTRAWCYPLMSGIGTVGVCVVTDQAVGGPIPSDEVLARVRERIEAVRPATVKEITVFAPEKMEITVRCKIFPASDALRRAVLLALEDLFAREGEPGVIVYRSHISEAVSLTAREVDHEILLPAANVTVPEGVLPLLAAVEFVGDDGQVISLPAGSGGGI